jgi:hypothetical protein
MSQKFAAYNAQGAIIGFYDSVDSPVPTGVAAIEISDAQWQACLATPGYTVVNGALVAPAPPTEAETLAAAQADQIAVLSAACAAAIVAGFQSTALGSTYTYPAKTTDQQNLSASIIAALLEVGSASQWTPDTVFAAGQAVNAGSQIYLCIVGGTSGMAAPTWPAVGAIADDGSAQWQVWSTPFWCEDPSGNWNWINHTSAQIQQVGKDAKAAILANMAKNGQLAAQVMAATTVTAVQAITW